MAIYRTCISAVMLLLVHAGGCSTAQPYSIEDFVGLYRIVEKECLVETASFDPCEKTFFFEVVKGTFAGIGPSEFGYAFWSGTPEMDGALQYESHRFRIPPVGTLDGNRLWINRGSGGAQEYLLVSKGYPTKYVASFATIEGDSTRTIVYSLEGVPRENLSGVRLNYPNGK